MCLKTSHGPYQATSKRASRQKPPFHVVIRVTASALSLGVVLLALLLPSLMQDHGENGGSNGFFSFMSSRDNTQNIESKVSVSSTSNATIEENTIARGTYIGSELKAKDLFRAYQEIQNDYQERAFSDTKGWKILAEESDIQVALLEHPGDPQCPYVRMLVTMPLPVADCWDFLELDNWDVSMRKMDPFYEGVELHGDFTHQKVHMRLARKRTTRMMTFAKRDFVFLSVSEETRLEDGSMVAGTVSVRTPNIPRQEGYVRAYQDSIAFYKPVQVDGKEHAQVTMILRLDLNDNSGGTDAKGGWVPMWLYVKSIGPMGVRSLKNMRDVLVEQSKLKSVAADGEHNVVQTRDGFLSSLLSWGQKLKESSIQK